MNSDDMLRSVRAISNQVGDVIAGRDFLPFGRSENSRGSTRICADSILRSKEDNPMQALVEGGRL